eukprot:13078451-Alexandrium_andersonii.AAC.1
MFGGPGEVELGSGGGLGTGSEAGFLQVRLEIAQVRNSCSGDRGEVELGSGRGLGAGSEAGFLRVR